MTEMLFTDYKNAVRAGLAGCGYRVGEDDEADFLRVVRLAHKRGRPPWQAERAARCCLVPYVGDTGPGESEHLAAKEEMAGLEQAVTLTEAGETALAQRDQLKSVDAALSLPVSSPVSAPLPVVDHCEDDTLLSPRVTEQAAIVDPPKHKPDVARHTGQDRKAPRK